LRKDQFFNEMAARRWKVKLRIFTALARKGLNDCPAELQALAGDCFLIAHNTPPPFVVPVVVPVSGKLSAFQ
jgi:hypothetical protein